MSKNINEFKEFVEFCANKVQSGNSVDTDQFNELANRAQMQLFEQDFNTFLQTKSVSEYLKTFLKNTSILINTFGEGNYPSDFQHVSSMRSYFVPTKGNAYEVEVKEESNADWGKLQASQLFKATKRWPKYSEFGSNLRFLPRDLGVAQLDYFKTPVKPIWGFTVVSNDPVYNPSTSTDFEWDDFSTNQVAAMYLALIGVNLKDGELAQFAEMYKAQTK